MPAAVIFDLDGTLLDTLEDLAAAGNRVLAGHGFPTHPIADYRSFVGSGARKLVERALPPDERSAALIEDCLEEFRVDYAESWNVKTRVYPGVPAMLRRLTAHGVSVGVNTNKPQHHAEMAVAGYLGDLAISAVAGHREGIPLKPDPAGALALARAMGVDPAHTFFVGDSPIDIRTARAASMPSIGVTWGFRTEEELRQEGAGHIVGVPGQVADIVLRASAR